MMSIDGEVVTSVRVSGIPSDVNEIEFARWFLFAQGFVRATITTKTLKGQIGLVRFTTLDAAWAAIHALNGRTLSSDESLDYDTELTAELAKVQLKMAGSRNRPFSELESQPGAQSSQSSLAGSGANQPSNVMVVSNLSLGVSESHIFAVVGRLPGFSEIKASVEGEETVAFLHFDSVESCTRAMSSVRSSSLETARGGKIDCQFALTGNPPSDVMVIGNLSPEVSEEELNSILMTFPGFTELHYSSIGPDGPIAFAHFTSIDCCGNAVHALHGSAMPGALTQLLVCDFYDGEGRCGQRGANSGGKRQSSTLVITSMPMGYTEQELTEFIGTVCPGFKSLSLREFGNGKGETFISRFSTAENAQAALQVMMVSLYKNSKTDDLFKVDFDESEVDGDETTVQAPVSSAPGHAPPPSSKQHFSSSHLADMDLALKRELEAVGVSSSPPVKHGPAVFPIITTTGSGKKMATFPPVTGLPNNGLSSHDMLMHEPPELEMQLREQQHPQPEPQRPEKATVPNSDGKCSTLFSSNLHRNCSEEELNQFFATRFEGFVRLKFAAPTSTKGGMCWVRFATVEYAEAALASCRAGGYCLPGDPTKMLQVDFARNDLDCRGVDTRTASAAETTHALMGNPPCDTMFIGALSPEVSEEEMLSCMALLPGFFRLKYVSSGQRPVAFAQFDSVENCAQALQVLHGSAFPSAPNQAIDCQFSKNPLDSKRPRMGVMA